MNPLDLKAPLSRKALLSGLGPKYVPHSVLRRRLPNERSAQSVPGLVWRLPAGAPMLVVTRGSGRVVAANDAALCTYGYSRQELLVRTVHDLFGAAGGRALLAQCGTTLSWTGPWTQRRKDGSSFSAEIGVLQVDDGVRPPAAMIIIDWR